MPSSPESISVARRQRDRAMAAAVSAKRDLHELEAALRTVERSSGPRSRQHADRIRDEIDRRRTEVAGALEGQRGLSDAAAIGLHEWLRQTPEQIVERLPDRDPFLLFPVRLETRFALTPAGARELRIRIWPDDIGVALPPGDLTAPERQAGDQYWSARATSATTPAATPAAEEARRAYEGAWTAIATRYGAYRAGYVVRETRPALWTDLRKPPPLPLVPPTPVPSTEPRIARAAVLPDRFVIVGSFQGQTLPDVVGAPIPDDLALAPDPAHGTPFIERDAAGRLVVAEPLRWMVDFDAAVSVGMGIRIPLSPPWDTTGFDLLMAIGVRSTDGADDGVAHVEALLAKHRFDTGCGIVRNGTPTNNTDSAVSGWRPPSTEAEQLFTIEEEPPDISPAPGPLGESDGHRLVRLLGLSQELVRRLPNALATDIAEAQAMNRAASFATILEFVKEFLEPLISRPTRHALRTFFHQHVSGRGILPALRIGRQPYGIVVTSDWSRWTFETTPASRHPIEQQLFALLQMHRPAFQALATQPIGPASDSAHPFQRLMRTIGHLASSAQYATRQAFPDVYALEQLAKAGLSRDDLAEWIIATNEKRGPNLRTVLRDAPGGPLLRALLFFEETDGWTGAIVDREPKVPLSEREPIAGFNGTRNYLQWLATASLPNLENESFFGPTGAAVAPPTALLYVLLRYSLLTAVEEGTLEVATVAGDTFFDVITRDSLIANIGQSQHLLRKDYLAVNAQPLGLSTEATPLGKWVHESSRTVAVGSKWAAALAVVTDANESIGALAGVPTARLERLLAEHVDLCSYRLDAWVTALYSQRLEQMRNAEEGAGLYIGAYGWVENLIPDWTARTRIPADALPSSLRDAAAGPVFVSTDNGGFVHAPSLQQACTAAVLRNAYLSHATEEDRDRFSINLSSARVRVAQTFIEGIRNGQSIAALLGYEFERGLHERHPGVELDQYRYVLRDRFPYMAGKLTELQVGLNAEVVEARNVVNGLDLLEHTADQPYPYGLAGLPNAGTGEAIALAEEIDRLRAGLDAVSDLLLAESVHQAVAGNMERTKASLQALTDPEVAPDPEVVRTPRPARLLTFRMTLALDTAASAKWPGPLTPRAAANPSVNAWLADHLPAPSAIQWSVKNGATPQQFGSAADLHLQPIDLVMLTGDRLGQLSSELERILVRRFRSTHKVADDVRTRVAPLSGPPDPVPPLVFDFAVNAAANQSLAALHPLLVRLRRLLTRGRAMHALDWMRATEFDHADAADPTGSASGDARLTNLQDLNARLDAGVAGLKTVKAALEAAVAVLAPVQPLVDAVIKAFFDAHDYGIPEAVPAEGETLSQALVDTLTAQAHVILSLVEKRLGKADALRAPDTLPLPAGEPERTLETARRIRVALERATDAARELFGAAFVVVPLFRFNQPAQQTELQLAAADPPIADPFELEEWLHSAARVRPTIADVTWTMATSTWIGNSIGEPLVVQLPRQAGTPWIGGEFTTPLPEGEWLAVLRLGNAPGFSGLQCGLVLDEWTENVPGDSATTGLGFHFNRPNATAPQALLLAVPPVLRGHWQWDALKGSVREALDLAKLRALDPEALAASGYFQGLPAILSEFSKNRFAATHLTERSVKAAQRIVP
jgi:hypothetical protein